MNLLILFVGLALRLPLMWQSLWLDESIEALALMGKQGNIWEYALKDFQPPLYHLIGLAWTHLAGFSEFALRTPSLLCGLLAIYFVIKLGELWGGKRVGAIAGVLAATNPLLIYYSAEGRTYMMTTAFVAGSFYFLAKLISDVRARRASPLLYLFFTLAAVWTSYIAWAVLALQLTYLLLIKRYDLAKWALMAGLSLLLWLPSFLSSLGIGLGTVSASPEWGKVVGGISLKALALTWVKAVIGRISFDNKYLYGLVMVVLFFLHEHAIRFARKVNPLLIIWLGVILVAAFISLFVPVYSYFRVLFVVPSYLILLGIGLANLRRPWYYVIILSQLIFVGIYYVTPRFHHEDWRTLARDIRVEPNSAVGMPSLAQDAPLIYYDVTAKIFEPKKKIFGYDRIFYINYVEDLFDTSRTGRQKLEQAGYTIQRSKTYPGLQVDVYVP